MGGLALIYSWQSIITNTALNMSAANGMGVPVYVIASTGPESAPIPKRNVPIAALAVPLCSGNFTRISASAFTLLIINEAISTTVVTTV